MPWKHHQLREKDQQETNIFWQKTLQPPLTLSLSIVEKNSGTFLRETTLFYTVVDETVKEKQWSVHKNAKLIRNGSPSKFDNCSTLTEWQANILAKDVVETFLSVITYLVIFKYKFLVGKKEISHW